MVYCFSNISMKQLHLHGCWWPCCPRGWFESGCESNHGLHSKLYSCTGRQWFGVVLWVMERASMIKKSKISMKQLHLTRFGEYATLAFVLFIERFSKIDSNLRSNARGVRLVIIHCNPWTLFIFNFCFTYLLHLIYRQEWLVSSLFDKYGWFAVLDESIFVARWRFPIYKVYIKEMENVSIIAPFCPRVH
jgi:hypothetical protein